MPEFKTLLRKAYMNGARYSGVSALLAPLLRGVGAILMLHHVRPDEGGLDLNGYLSVEPDFLDGLIGDLKGEGIRFVTLDEVVDRLKAGHADERFLSITLDDGYRDNLLHAAPVFRAHDAPYTVFVAAGFADGSADVWWDYLAMIVEDNESVTWETARGPVTLPARTPREKRHAYAALIDHALTEIDEDEQRALVRRLAETYGVDREAHRARTLMCWEELGKLDADPLATIGAHTVNHFQLHRLPRERALAEMVRSADAIAAKLGARPRHFAYPYGNTKAAGAREVELAREAGFATAVTTRHGVLMPRHAEALHALPRISVNGNYQRVDYIRTMLTGITMPAANYGRTFVTV